MTREVNIDPFYWSLWAQRRRGNLAQNGYPKEVPFYQPPALGNLYVDDGERKFIYDEDIVVVEGIEAALIIHRNRRPTEVHALEIWEGAYVDASPDRDKRMEHWKVHKPTCKKAAYRAKRWVERYMYGGC